MLMRFLTGSFLFFLTLWNGAGQALGQPTAPRDTCAATRYVRVNIHFVQDEAGRNNFQPTDDPTTPLDEDGYRWAQMLIWAANWPHGWSENPPMVLPVGNRTPALPKRIQLVLTGVYFDRAPAAEQHYTDSNAGSGYLFEHFGRDKGRAINVFVLDRAVPGSTGGIADGIGANPQGAYWCKILSPWYGANLPKPIAVWGYANILNHELGHVLGLGHTYSAGRYDQDRPTDWDGCPDTPDNPNCWDENDPKCTRLKVPEPPSNNQMDYNNVQNALTPCQIGRIHANLSGPMRGLVVACGDCAPPHAFFGLDAGGRVIDRRYDPRRDGALRLNGASSVNEQRYVVSIQEVATRDSSTAEAPARRLAFTGQLDDAPQGALNLSGQYNFRRRRQYRLTLWVANGCGADSITQYLNTRPLSRRERRAARAAQAVGSASPLPLPAPPKPLLAEPPPKRRVPVVPLGAGNGGQ